MSRASSGNVLRSVQDEKVHQCVIQFRGYITDVPKQLKKPGGLAQLGERLPCKQEVTGSIPVLSTIRSAYMGQ